MQNHLLNDKCCITVCFISWFYHHNLLPTLLEVKIFQVNAKAGSSEKGRNSTNAISAIRGILHSINVSTYHFFRLFLAYAKFYLTKGLL